MSHTAVIGIDPSLSATGLCWGSQYGRTVRLKGDNPRRLVDLFDAVCETLSETVRRALARDPYTECATLTVIEDLPANAQSAGLTGQAQGVVRMALQDWGVPFITVAPASLKKFATGKGTSNKEAMVAAYPHALPVDWDDNTVDAYWLRQMGLAYLGREGGMNPEHFGKAKVAKWSTLYPSGKS